ncbi:50S ribosomal protein L24 [Cytophagaceae bacterium ABcell3]|nr:50S ribosomal protein L24 [Cytophagaceae bacterium ABcell3]
MKKQNKFHIKRGDTVKVLTGDNKNNTGIVKVILPKDNKAIVEGVNIVSKHVKPDASNPNGGIVKKEAPVHISNLMLIDPATNEPTRVGRKLDKNNKLQRYSKKTGEIINNG